MSGRTSRVWRFGRTSRYPELWKQEKAPTRHLTRREASTCPKTTANRRTDIKVKTKALGYLKKIYQNSHHRSETTTFPELPPSNRIGKPLLHDHQQYNNHHRITTDLNIPGLDPWLKSDKQTTTHAFSSRP